MRELEIASGNFRAWDAAGGQLCIVMDRDYRVLAEVNASCRPTDRAVNIQNGKRGNTDRDGTNHAENEHQEQGTGARAATPWAHRYFAHFTKLMDVCDIRHGEVSQKCR